MRTYRLGILILLVACKASSPGSTSGSYSEDLSIHRPVIVPQKKSENVEDREVKTEPYVQLSGHIKQELDSISQLAYLENKAGKYVDGFVIQVYSGTSRDDANNVRYKMGDLFPELNPKVSYHQPTFRVKAGRFTNRLKAYRVYAEVKKEFPRALLIPERFLQKYE